MGNNTACVHTINAVKLVTDSFWLRTQTSRTFFLLDLSLDAQVREAPLSSTVYSGMIWLVLLCKGQKSDNKCNPSHRIQKVRSPSVG